jgi:hypothetical protein
MTKIKPLLILLQWLGIFLLINGFLRLFYSLKGAEIEYLKIDVEGYEEWLLKQLIKIMLDGRIIITKELKFECNHLSDQRKLYSIADGICNHFGFAKQFVIENWNKDLVLTKI